MHRPPPPCPPDPAAPATARSAAGLPGGPTDWRHLLAQAAVVVAAAAWWAWALPALSAPAAALPAAGAAASSPSAPALHARRHAPRHHAHPQVQVGRASFYSHRLAGRPMASGRPFHPDQNVAASRTLPLGTEARVTNLDTGRSTTVRIEDRGPVPPGRVVDLSPAAARQIGLHPRQGLAPVAVEPVSMPASAGGPPRSR